MKHNKINFIFRNLKDRNGPIVKAGLKCKEE
jgi:hypothetical protein